VISWDISEYRDIRMSGDIWGYWDNRGYQGITGDINGYQGISGDIS
jgi:hypothetical protein